MWGGGGGVEKGVVLVYGKGQSMSKTNGDRLLLWHILWVDCHIAESCDDRMKFASSILRASCTYTHINLSDRDTEISAVMLISQGFMIIAQLPALHLRVMIINPWIFAEITAQLIRKVIIYLSPLLHFFVMGFTLAEGLIFTPKLCTYTFSSPKMNLDFKLFHTSQQYEFLNKHFFWPVYM